MQIRSLREIRSIWRTTTVRLTFLYGLFIAIGTVSVLGVVYIKSAAYLTQRVDDILTTEADALVHAPPLKRGERIDEALALDGGRMNVFALFSQRGQWLAGNLRVPPAGLSVDGRPLEITASTRFATHIRVIARRLPDGEELVVGRDVNQLRELRAIIASALLWSGVTIILVGLASGTALSIPPLRRLRLLQAAAQDIAGGNLMRRMPTSRRRDELDMFAATVNYMMDQVERLMSEVKGSTDTIAHDLRTPLARARSQLYRMHQAATCEPQDVARVMAEIDEVLDRFRALLRISELEARGRQAGFSSVDLAGVVEQVVDLYQPLAEAGGVQLSADLGDGATADADPKLLFEAVSNLIDNAIKFSAGRVDIRVDRHGGSPRIVVQDNGPGIPQGEWTAVLHRFYRIERDRMTPGSGLGLSIVAAIVRLHGFELTLEDAQPGLRVTIWCRFLTLKY
jgi:signal transduction histidine kinase